MAKQSVTETLRTALKTSTESRYQISKATGIDQASLSRFVNGKRAGFSMENVDSLCDHLGLILTPVPKKAKGM